MKVLMFGWEFPPHISGGLGTACYGLTKGLSHVKDIDITFVIPKAFGDEEQVLARVIGANNVMLSDQYINYEGFLREIKLVEIDSKLVPYQDPEEYEKISNSRENGSKTLINTVLRGKIDFQGGYGGGLWQEISNYAIVAGEIAKKYAHDVIHAHDWLTFPAGIAAKNVSGKPLVVHVHATEFDRSGGSVNPGVYEIEKKGLEAADKIITVSNLTRDTVVYKYGIPAEKVTTIYNAVEPYISKEAENYKKSINEKIVTFLGRITMQKGPEYFIEAANLVLRKMHNARFVMAGSGDMFQKMIRRAAQLKITDRFHFTGFLKGDDVYKMFAISDVYVMPSVSEPFGISPLEAMQSSVPVIISYQSGVSEILKYAIKVNFWDVEAMADAIYGVLNYNALPDIFKKYGKAEVENLKWENSARKVKEVYDSVVKPKITL
ncbi:MAG: glycosyltransferase family 4 protein [Bacteroidota bacterium]